MLREIALQVSSLSYGNDSFVRINSLCYGNDSSVLVSSSYYRNDSSVWYMCRYLVFVQMMDVVNLWDAVVCVQVPQKELMIFKFIQFRFSFSTSSIFVFEYLGQFR
jgi:hypothetical protein